MLNYRYAKSIKELSNMQPVKNQRMKDVIQIQGRLLNGKKDFEQIVQMVLDALIKMSALDLALGKNSKEMIAISERLFEVADRIQEASHISTKSAGEVTQAHENL